MEIVTRMKGSRIAVSLPSFIKYAIISVLRPERYFAHAWVLQFIASVDIPALWLVENLAAEPQGEFGPSLAASLILTPGLSPGTATILNMVVSSYLWNSLHRPVLTTQIIICA